MFNSKKQIIALLEGLIVELEQTTDAMDGYLKVVSVYEDVKEVFKEEIDRKAEPLNLFEDKNGN